MDSTDLVIGHGFVYGDLNPYSQMIPLENAGAEETLPHHSLRGGTLFALDFSELLR